MLSIGRTLSFLVFATLPALVLVSCSGGKTAVRPDAGPLTAERPRDEAFRTELKKEASSINVAVEASTEELAGALNQIVPGDVYKGSTGTGGVTAEVLRNGPIAVTAADDYLYLTVPLRMSLSYGMFKTPVVPFKVKFKAGAKVTSDWKINAELYYAGLSDLLAEQIGIGPLSIRPRAIVEGITQPVQKVISDSISRKINEKYPLRAEVAKAWRDAQKPVLLDKNYNAWLKITPQEVMLYPLSARDNRVKLSLGITSFAEVVVGPEPPARAPVPLPNLRLVKSFDKTFRVALNTDLYYRDILSIASPLLLNRELGSDGKSVVLKNIDVYGNGDRLVLRVEATGSLDGVFYLTCRPGINPETNIFSVEDVDFDMQTKSLLLQSADWFLHGTIRSAIREKLNVDLTQRLEKSRELARIAMARVPLAEKVFLKGSIGTMKIADVMVQKDRISVQVYAEGETAVVFK
jgi:hypothetical protein